MKCQEHVLDPIGLRIPCQEEEAGKCKLCGMPLCKKHLYLLTLGTFVCIKHVAPEPIKEQSYGI